MNRMNFTKWKDLFFRDSMSRLNKKSLSQKRLLLSLHTLDSQELYQANLKLFRIRFLAIRVRKMALLLLLQFWEERTQNQTHLSSILKKLYTAEVLSFCWTKKNYVFVHDISVEQRRKRSKMTRLPEIKIDYVGKVFRSLAQKSRLLL